ncbi:MAG: pol polyprotein, partial [Sedimenticola sp.]
MERSHLDRTKFPPIALNTVAAKQGYFLAAKINDNFVTFLIDSGASSTILSNKVIEKWPYLIRPKLTPVQSTLITVTGEATPFLGKTKIELCMGKQKIEQNVLVADIEMDGILGLDFLLTNQCDIMLSKGYITLKGERIPCFVNSEADHDICCRIAVGETVEIPPETEIIVSGKPIDPINRHKVGILEPKNGFMEKTGLMVARVLVDPKFGSVPIRLANFKKTPCTIYENTVAAVFEPVSVCTNQIQTKVENRIPEHMTELYEKSCTYLDSDQKLKLRDFLVDNQDIFSKSSDDLGTTHLVKHHIDTGNNKPVKTYPYRIPLAKRQIAEQEIQKMEAAGVIEPSCSSWLSPIQLVTKPDGSVRFCCDFRKLNDATIKEFQPLPRIDDNLDALSGSSWFGCLDMRSGFWQINVDEESRPKTSFSIQGGRQMQWVKMAFGLCNAPSTFSRLMQMTFSDLTYKILVLYLDDIIVYAKTFDQALENLKIAFERLREANLKLHPKKTILFQKEVTFLGHRISEEGISTCPEKVKAVKDWPTPRSVRDVRSFLGLASFYRKYIHHFSEKAKPLHELTEKGRKFAWNEECEQAFNVLKDALMSSSVLALPTNDDYFVVSTDASATAAGAILSQIQNGQEKVLAYYSKCFSRTERRYCATRRELYAVILAVRQFHHYVYGNKFTIRTDCASLRWLLNFKVLEGQLSRWLTELYTYNFVVEHRPGKLHTNCDALSRRPCYDAECRYCERTEAKYGASGDNLEQKAVNSSQVKDGCTSNQRGAPQPPSCTSKTSVYGDAPQSPRCTADMPGELQSCRTRNASRAKVESNRGCEIINYCTKMPWVAPQTQLCALIDQLKASSGVTNEGDSDDEFRNCCTKMPWVAPQTQSCASIKHRTDRSNARETIKLCTILTLLVVACSLRIEIVLGVMALLICLCTWNRQLNVGNIANTREIKISNCILTKEVQTDPIQLTDNNLTSKIPDRPCAPDCNTVSCNALKEVCTSTDKSNVDVQCEAGPSNANDQSITTDTTQ